ncbi:CLIP1 [Mytilus edulis]|uniref:CLIP1 n=1 Tax=Mytilus edulis TaxID=6550 RepID=A0A8S3T646_MYTED|nr:CLIP1 [Mytilus edulis]
MEASFTLALDKICTQQSDLFNSKFQLMEHYYNQSIETNNNNFKMLQDTITTILKPTSDNDKLAARIVSLEKENIILKSSVNEFKNTSAINIECWKSKIETLNAKEKFNDTKIVISLPTPRADEESLNNKAQILILMAKEDLRNEPNVEICDNSNMAFKASALQKYLDPKDNYHLSLNGTKMLASNIRDTTDRIIGLPPRTPMKRNVNQYNYTPPRVQRDNTNDFVPDDDSQQFQQSLEARDIEAEEGTIISFEAIVIITAGDINI